MPRGHPPPTFNVFPRYVIIAAIFLLLPTPSQNESSIFYSMVHVLSWFQCKFQLVVSSYKKNSRLLLFVYRKHINIPFKHNMMIMFKLIELLVTLP